MKSNQSKVNYRISKINTVDAKRRRRYPSIVPNQIIHVHVRTTHSLRSKPSPAHNPPPVTSSPIESITFSPSKPQATSASPRATSVTALDSAHSPCSPELHTNHSQAHSRRIENIDCIQTHHKNQKKKPKCSICTVLIIIIVVLLLLTGLTITLVLLLMKPKTATQDKVAVLRWNTTGVTIAGTPGSFGTGNNQLKNPWGLVITYDYSIFVAERGNHRIQKFNRSSTVGVTVAGSASGVAGSNNASLNEPSVILLDSDENLYIADANNHRIQYWRRGASSGMTVAGTGVFGSGLNQFYGPYGLTKDWNSDVLYVADLSNARVMSYSAGSSTGTLVFGGNGNGSNLTQLNAPSAIYLDTFSSSFLIANRDNSNVVRWKLGEPNWSLVAGNMGGIGGNTNNFLYRPHGVTVDPMGNVYVADTSNCRVQFFTVGQSVGVTIAGVTGFSGNTNVSVGVPFGIALDNQLNLYVADETNHRIQKFSRY